MADSAKEIKDQLDLLRSLPLVESEDGKVDALWRQLMIYKSFAGNDLSEARARRAQAEATREEV